MFVDKGLPQTEPDMDSKDSFLLVPPFKNANQQQ